MNLVGRLYRKSPIITSKNWFHVTCSRKHPKIVSKLKILQPRYIHIYIYISSLCFRKSASSHGISIPLFHLHAYIYINIWYIFKISYGSTSNITMFASALYPSEIHWKLPCSATLGPSHRARRARRVLLVRDAAAIFEGTDIVSFMGDIADLGWFDFES